MSTPLKDIKVYQMAMAIAKEVWSLIQSWDAFSKNSLGNQFIRAADSIGLNIAEGYGRFQFRENKNFNYYSRGSAFETASCLRKAFNRKLINEDAFTSLSQKINQFLIAENKYINSIGRPLDNIVKEDPEEYHFNDLLTNDPMTNDIMTNDSMTF